MRDEDLGVTERVTRYFVSKGYVLKKVRDPIKSDSERISPDLVFERDDTKVFVKLVNLSVLENSYKLMRVIMMISVLRSQCDKLYLAVPKLLATILDSDLLKEMGVGLITYDGKIVAEVLPAVSRGIVRPPPKPVDVQEARSEQSLTEIRALREVVEDLAREVRDIKRRLAAVERRMDELREEEPTISVQREDEIKEGGHLEPVVETSDLPSFIKDNPWIEILSMRGREGGDA